MLFSYVDRMLACVIFVQCTRQSMSTSEDGPHSNNRKIWDGGVPRTTSTNLIISDWCQMGLLLPDNWSGEIPVTPFKLILRNVNVIHKHLGVVHFYFHSDMEINQKWGVCWDANRPHGVKRARYYPIIGQGRSQSPPPNRSCEM